MPIDAHLKHVIDRAKRAPRLSASEEQECIRAWQQRRDRRAAGRLIEANTRHVVFAALKFKNYGPLLSDLISVGNLALMQALDRFDESKGARFATYAAYWIREHLVREVLDSWTVLSGPRGALTSRLFFRLRRERARLESLHGAEPPGEQPSTAERLAADFGVAPERMQEMLGQIDQRNVSLDALAPHGDDTLLPQLRSEQDQAASLESHEQSLRLARALERARQELDAREAFILERRLLADPEEMLSLSEIGAHFGISRERARQLELRARGKLQRAALDLAPGELPGPSARGCAQPLGAGSGAFTAAEAARAARSMAALA